jgi:pimeloyl-ACP methyl ester carboxylesterase
MSIKPLGALAILVVFLSSCSIPVTEKGILHASRASLPPLDSLRSGVIEGSPIEVQVESTIKLRGVHLKYPQSTNVILYCYGNFDYVAPLLPFLDSLGHTFKSDIVCVDYRGYGFSDGSPTLKDLQSDALKVYDAVLLAAGSKPVFVMGRSIGAGIALRMAATKNAAGVILLSPPSSIADLISGWNRGLPWYQRLIFSIKAADELVEYSPQPIDDAKLVVENVLVAHGEDDEVIPIELGEKVFKAISSPRKHWLPLSGVSHYGLKPYTEPIRSAIISVLAGSK